MPMKQQAVESLDDVLELLDQLTQEQEEQLRDKLNTRYLQRQVQHVVSGDLARSTSNALVYFFERLGSGEIDSEIKKASNVVWKDVVNKFETASEIFSPATPPSNAEDPESALEAAYQELQVNLIQVRQTVAHSIATEKQLEQQVAKNKEQASTWENRAVMAMQENNEDLAEQARQRQSQYLTSAAEVEEHFRKQQVATKRLRTWLTKLENSVQQAYVRKQVLIARHRGAAAMSKANKTLARMEKEKMSAAFERMEEEVTDHESAFASEALDQELNSEQLLAKAVAALEAATAVIEKMERFISKRED